MNDPLNFNTLDRLLEEHEFLLQNILDAVEERGDCQYVLGYECVDGIMSYAVDTEKINEMDLTSVWTNAPASVFFAQRLRWTSLPEPAPTKDSWLVSIVIPDKPAIFFCKNLEDELWEPLLASNVPWFAVFTTEAMREAQRGASLQGTLREAKNDDQNLFKTPEQLPEPPTEFFTE